MLDLTPSQEHTLSSFPTIQVESLKNMGQFEDLHLDPEIAATHQLPQSGTYPPSNKWPSRRRSAELRPRSRHRERSASQPQQSQYLDVKPRQLLRTKSMTTVSYNHETALQSPPPRTTELSQQMFETSLQQHQSQNQLTFPLRSASGFSQ